jgi:hypothetical protein
VLVAAWIVALAAGFCAFDVYELKAAGTGPMTQSWPAASSLRITPGVATVIMALHPRCPCSEASLFELQQVLAHQHASINVHLLVYQPKGYPADWGMTDLVRRAQAARGMDVMMDQGGEELSKFHARVSGELWFYDGTGKLLFRGGITGGRGHAGKNTGISSLMALLDGARPSAKEAPVFGCAIGGEDRNGNAPTK